MNNIYQDRSGKGHCSFCKSEVNNYQQHIVYCQRQYEKQNPQRTNLQQGQNQINIERMNQSYQQLNNKDSNGLKDTLSSKYSLNKNQIPQERIQVNERNNFNIPSQPQPMKQDREESKHNSIMNNNFQRENGNMSYYHPHPIQNQYYQEDIKCPNCEKSLTIEQIAIHTEQCQNRNVSCQFCSEQFPLSLIDEHLEVCVQAQNSYRQQSELRSSRIQMNQNNHQQQRAHQQHSHNHQNYQNNRNQQQQQNQRNNRDQRENHNRHSYQDQEEPFFQHQNQRRHEQIEQSHHPISILNLLFNFGEPSSNQTRYIQRPRSERSDQEGLMMMLNLMGGRNLQRQMQHILQNGNMEGYDHSNNGGLSNDQMKEFPIHKFKKRPQMSQDQLSCTICMSEFEENEDVKLLDCLHSYHSECIDSWLKKNTTCPICKKDMKEFV